jgi:anti-sigma factor RsiW
MDRTAIKSVTCEECIEVLVDYVDGTMDAVTVGAFEAHFADCPPCTDFLKTYKTTISVSRKVLDEPIPEAVSLRLRSFLQQKCQGKKPGTDF